ncbi:MAG: hypothetical protein KIT72_12800 [Polyangiaceae bacterium]|nr:hypothetical protein [Polyangiaceae bacterium]MCW5791292.1 hypothetical protein [Polyangiaceae bacterium]
MKKLGLGVWAAAALLMSAGAAQADASAEACVESYEQAQVLRQEGDLLKARAELLTCASASCLTALQKDCVQWLSEVDSSLPTVVFEVKGAELSKIEARVDGEDVSEDARAGRAVRVNPGRRTLTVKTADGDEKQLEVSVVEGQKNRVVSVDFSPAPDPEDSLSVSTSDAVEPSVLPWVFAGIGVVGFGVATFGWLSAEGKRSDVESSGCAPRCDPADRDSIERSRLIGDIGLGVGLVSFGVATVLWLTAGPERAPASPAEASFGFDLRGAPGGGVASWYGAF